MESSIKLKESNNSNGNQQQQQSQSQPTSQSAATNPHALCNGNGSSHSNSSASNAAVSISICSSDSFGSIMPPPATAATVAVVAGTATVAGGARDHELVSANSIELNAAASLSDDSGVPLTTNSSISSGDSYRIGMCKFEIEVSPSWHHSIP